MPFWDWLAMMSGFAAMCWIPWCLGERNLGICEFFMYTSVLSLPLSIIMSHRVNRNQLRSRINLLKRRVRLITDILGRDPRIAEGGGDSITSFMILCLASSATILSEESVNQWFKELLGSQESELTMTGMINDKLDLHRVHPELTRILDGLGNKSV
jgi:hypothetical protein